MHQEPLSTSTNVLPRIVYARYATRQVAGEQFIAEHGMCYIIAGSVQVADAGETHSFGAGSLIFCRKNFLAKFTKLPAENGPMQAITVVLDRATLLEFSQQYGLGHEGSHVPSVAVQSLADSPLLHSFYATLQSYFEVPLPAPLARLKQHEAIMLLLQAHPALQSVLFDFGQPGKIDLEAFMQQNFRFNVALKQLAYLTGRSLATFKRDFEKTFHTSPNRWLYQRRLEEAHYLLKEANRRPSDVYHEVGFESLAHFSYAFKQFFGRNPSSIHAPFTAG
jgi:AraC-like DNA-binding protein